MLLLSIHQQWKEKKRKRKRKRKVLIVFDDFICYVMSDKKA